MAMVDVRLALPRDAQDCASVLARLPDHFTTNTHVEAMDAVRTGPAWVAIDGREIVGFVAVGRRYTQSAEITFAAVDLGYQGKGVGSTLVKRALEFLARENVYVVEVKTLDESAGYEPYVATRGFWEKHGFVQIDCIVPLPGWDPGSPCAIYVASLHDRTE
jgi:ribosomal protein S18 acetylase RimI-like enzyme